MTLKIAGQYSIERTPSENSAEKPMRERQMAAYHKALEYVQGRRVLEIGCGEGIGASILATKAASVVAIDYSEEALRTAQARYGGRNIEFALMKVPPIDFEDESFDVVISFQMIEHLEEPQGLITEIKRILRSEGAALLATVNKDEMLSNNPYHVHEFTALEFEEFVRKHFVSAELYGVFGDDLFMRYWENNRKWVRGVLRADVFNLSARLPLGLRKSVYDIANQFMRIFLKQRDPDLCNRITYRNLVFQADRLERSLDFFAVCRKSLPKVVT
jgi:ubiquinone/menaquinone biosynthesis C-methylase UbiE